MFNLGKKQNYMSTKQELQSICTIFNSEVLNSKIANVHYKHKLSKLLRANVTQTLTLSVKVRLHPFFKFIYMCCVFLCMLAYGPTEAKKGSDPLYSLQAAMSCQHECWEPNFSPL